MQREAIERLKRIDHLIRIKGTGTPAQLASRIGISRGAFYLYLNLMRDLGAPISSTTTGRPITTTPTEVSFSPFSLKTRKASNKLNGS